MIGQHAFDLVGEVRLRLHDTGGRVYTPAQVLAAGDDCVRTIWDIVRTCGDAQSLDREDFAVSGWTTVQSDAVERDLPFYIGDIQRVDAVYGSGSSQKTQPIVRAGMEDMDVGRHDDAGGPRWLFTRGQNLTTIQIRGAITGATSIRIWFVRSWGPLCYGTGTTGGGSSSSVLIAAGVVGGFKTRTGLYVGSELEVYGDSGNPSNVGQIARITAQTGSTFTLNPALPATTSATTLWALLLPVPPAGSRLLIELATLDLLRRSGNDEEVALTMALVYGTGPTNLGLKAEFEQHIRMRTSGEPRRITSSRVYGR